VTPDVPLAQVPGSLCWLTFLMTLFYWNASSVPILPQGEQFPRVICLLAFLCSHYKIRLYQKICLDYIS